MNNANMPLLKGMISLFLFAALCAAAHIPAWAFDRAVPSFDIPKLAAITIDGKTDDWQDGGFRVDSLPMLGCGLRPTDDFDVRMRLGWDEQGLLVLLSVKDNIGYEHVQVLNLYRNDAVQLFLANKRDNGDEISAQINTGLDPRFPELRTTLGDRRNNEELRKVKLEAEAAHTLIPGGYQIEARLPWKCLGITPAAGSTCAFNVYVYDRDKPYSDITVAQWYPQWYAVIDTSAMYNLRLAEQPALPVQVAAWTAYASDRPGQVRITLAAPESFVGKDASLEGLGTAKFQERDGRAVAMLYTDPRTFTARRPKDKLMVVKVANQQVGTLDQEMIPSPDSLAGASKDLPQPFGSMIPRTMRKLAESTPEHHNKVKIIIYGQSIMAQEWWMNVARELHERYPNADLTVMNKAIGGVTTPWLLRTAEADIYPEYPDLIIFHAYEVQKDGSLEKLVRNFRSRTSAEILILSHHPSESGPGRLIENQTLQQVAAKYGCEYVANSEEWDYYLLDGRGPSSKAQDYRMDGIHLNALGFQLESFFVAEHFQFDPAFHNDWSNTITSITPKPDARRRVKLTFDGNRVDLIAAPAAAGQKLGSATILVDGKAPSKFPELYAKTLATWTEPDLWVFPPAWRVLSEKPLVLEDWTCRVTKIVPASAPNKNDGYFEFEVEGSKTGKDGTGRSDTRFVSNSGRVVLEPEWMLYNGTGKAFTWKVIPQFIDTYRATAVTDPSREISTTLFQGLAPGKHTLEIVPNGDGIVPIAEIRVHRPPLQQTAQ